MFSDGWMDDAAINAQSLFIYTYPSSMGTHSRMNWTNEEWTNLPNVWYDSTRFEPGVMVPHLAWIWGCYCSGPGFSVVTNI